MIVATWNVNSIRAREERLLAFLARHAPDVVCLQEIKVRQEEFPFETLAEAGYHAAVNGQKAYNGVAILTKDEPKEVKRGFGDGKEDSQARFLQAHVGATCFASVYVPNGGEVGSEKWSMKLEWLKRLRKWLDENMDPEKTLILAGDFNVAPEERDVENPDQWESSVLFHPDVREALADVVEWGLFDSLRIRNKEAGLYTWWDYRRLAFPRNDGLRIDHLYLSRPLVGRCAEAWIDREERKGGRPSDHAPVIAAIDV